MAQLVKNLLAIRKTQEMQVDPWVRKIPWRRAWLSTPVLLPGKFHGQRSLTGCRPWGHKEWDMTEQLNWTELNWSDIREDDSVIKRTRILINATSLDFPGGSEGKVSAYNAGDMGSIPGTGRSPGEGNGNPLQYSCLENPMDRGAWETTVHGVTKSRTRLSNFTSLG